MMDRVTLALDTLVEIMQNPSVSAETRLTAANALLNFSYTNWGWAGEDKTSKNAEKEEDNG